MKLILVMPDGLVPFTRWITPPAVGRRFTTQMYLYMLPVSDSLSPAKKMIVPTPDGGIEHTAAAFDDANTWLRKQDAGDIILFPPQYFLLTLVAEMITPGCSTTDIIRSRQALLDFASVTPATQNESARGHLTSQIPWTDKVISPHVLFLRKGDGRVVLSLEKPGPELKSTERGGDWERVILVDFTDHGPKNLEVRDREDVIREERVSHGGNEAGQGDFVMKI